MSESLTPPTPESSFNGHGAIKAIEGSSVHRLTSGQVVIDLQTAVKELVENSLDAGATSIDVRFKNCGLKSIEVVDNGSGISEQDFDSIGRKHHTSKLAAFHDLMTLTSFGFRGEALSSLCALCEGVTVTTATTDKAPMCSVLEFDKRGEIKSRAKGVKQCGTTVLLTSLFAPLPVRRKELERNIKREFGKALALLNAYALGPCCGLGADKAVRFSVTNQPDKGAKTTHISLPLPSPAGVTLSLRTVRAGTTALWGPKALGGVIDLDLEFEVPRITGRKVKGKSRVEEDVELREDTFKIHVKGLISSPTPIPSSGSTPRSGGSARSTTDRQFFYVNGRPCTLSKIQKAINDIYRTFIPSNATSGQFPFVVADFTIPGDAVDVNVTPDKRTILVHAEAELCDRMKDALDNLFSPSRSTYGVSGTQSLNITSTTHNQGMLPFTKSANVQGSVDTQASQAHDIGGGAKDDGTVEPGATTSVLSYGDVDCRLADTRPEEYTFHGASADVAEESLGIDDPQISLIPSVSHEPQTIEVNPPEQPSPHSKETPVPPRTVVISTTGASWNRPKNSFGEPVNLSMQSPRIAGLAGTATKSVYPILAQHTKSQMEPPLKKRKSEVANEDDTDEEISGEDNRKRQGQKKKPSSSGHSVNGKVARLVSTSPQAKFPDNSSRKTNRQEMRSQIAGFARSGSRVVYESSDTGEDEQEKEAEVEKIEDCSNRNPEEEEDNTQEMQIDKTTQALFLPDDDEDENENESSIIVDTSDDLFIASARSIRKTSSFSTLSVSTRITTPPASSLILDVNDKTSEMIDLTLDENNYSLLSSDDNHLQTQNEPIHRPEVIRTEASQSSVGDVKLRLDVPKLAKRWATLHPNLHGEKSKRELVNKLGKKSSSSLSDDAGVSATDTQTSEAALSRVISKEDFKEMEVLGQFNLGFIIVRRWKKSGTEQGLEESLLDDLFIVDQHAADEKYNFETLQQTTNIESQKLLHPRPLELTASDELVALENLDVLRLNGFELEVVSDAQEEEDIEMVDDNPQSRVHRKLRLIAQPVSKSTVFDMRDLEELIQLLHNRPTGQMVRCSKARAMFAMRACRKSFMIGMPLNKSQMSTIVTHMGTIDQPWNCPHGRPTMRHLFDMTNLQPLTQNIGVQRKVDWTGFE
ncbi:hypothetical protein C8J55DRAFT_246485 [Lentinula edodes]|uniref:DNA mismatch repair protein MutL n=1 Tax=Lentinula lateritia TaxID=40482 RepID=A0A9W9DEZ0_9AGAR|nr:hypothetical protein C8J55DRAFT_246485 [Lentinula edodes]